MLELFVIYRRLNNDFDAQRCDYLKVTDNIVAIERAGKTVSTHFPINRLVAVIPVDLSNIPAINSNSDFINEAIPNYNLNPNNNYTTKPTEPTPYEQENADEILIPSKIRSLIVNLLRRNFADTFSRLSKNR